MLLGHASLEEIIEEFPDSLTCFFHISIEVVTSFSLVMSRMGLGLVEGDTISSMPKTLLVPFSNDTFVLHCDALHLYTV